MSQALHILIGVVARTNTCIIFINQIRENIGFFFYCSGAPRDLHSFPTRRSSDLDPLRFGDPSFRWPDQQLIEARSEEHTSELQSPDHLVCRLLLEKKKLFPQVASPLTSRSASAASRGDVLLRSTAPNLPARPQSP